MITILDITDTESNIYLKELNIDSSILIHGLDIKDEKQVYKILNTLFKEVKEGKISNESDVLIQRAFDLKDL